MNSRTCDNTLFYEGGKFHFVFPIVMVPHLKKTVEALLLSTAEPIQLKDLQKIFSRYAEEAAAQAAAAGSEDGGDDLGDDHGEDHGLDGVSGDALAEAVTHPAGVSDAALEAALRELTDEAEVEDKAYRVVEGPAGFQIVTAPQYAEFVRLLRGEPRPMKLSPAALETVSIIAYRQPVTRAEIEAIRGVSVDSALNKLIELELVVVTGRAELPGRPIQYGTTDKFLEFTGIKELDALPASDVLSHRQIDDWMRRSEEPEAPVSDADVGLSREPEPSELPLDATFVEVDWQRENAESDAASGRSET
jgi:segregation and condensation protein B